MTKKGKMTKPPTRAAAIPYKYNAEATMRLFLVVTTDEDQRRWTFPKGKFDREKGDTTLEDTAAREAREEAGVKGNTHSKELMEYPFPKKDGGNRRVLAYLLAVTEEGLPREKNDAERDLMWCSAEGALEKLSEKRKPNYRGKMKKVLKKALDTLHEQD
jgi:8-oxo-dGTP pyrophosphatase MutT (NUDIX family)